MKKFWTLRYALINITYFAAFCCVHAYASVFLLDKGFDNTTIGMLLAAANLLSVIVQPLIAGLIDKPGKFTNRNVILISVCIMMAGSLLLYFVKSSLIAIFIIYAVIYMVQMAYQPLIIAMNFEYADYGCKINFGLARGLGSAGFAVTSAFMGAAVEKSGINVLLYTEVIMFFLALLVVFFFKKPETANQVRKEEKPDQKAHNNIFEFAKLYPKFMLLLFGIVCLFFAHNALNDYLIQIVRDLGGSEKQMGYATFFQAILELPMMAVAGKLIERFGTKKLLVLSAVFFTIKVFILYIAKGMTGLYISQSLQLLAYAVLIPVAAYYVTEVLQELDRVKGQAFINCAITVSGVFSNLICGRILDLYGSKNMLLIGCFVSLLGIVLVVRALFGKSSEK